MLMADATKVAFDGSIKDMSPVEDNDRPKVSAETLFKSDNVRLRGPL